MFEKMNHWLTLIANLGVVAGIVFLALEVRQTGNVAEAAARQEVAAHDFLFLASVLDNSVLAEASAKQTSGTPLSPLDESQLVHRQHLNFRIFEHSFYQYEKGLLDEEEWTRHERIARSVLANDVHAQRMWTSLGSSFSSGFAEMLNGSPSL
jgi:hypothetical protein